MSSLYQHGTLAMLMGKQMQGSITTASLLTRGDTGIGTLDGLDGEVIILNGEVYQAKSDGHVERVTDMDSTMPFVSVHFDQPTAKLPFSAVSNATLSEQLSAFDINNIFVAVNFHAEFTNMHVRVAPKQVQPYPSLLEVAQNQPEFTYQNVSGVVVGYFAPEIYNGPTAAGWHLHFISDDKTQGGHILNFNAQNVDGGLQIFDDFVQHLPIQDDNFRKMSLDMDGLLAGIKASEEGE